MFSFQFTDAIINDKWETAVEIFIGENMWARVVNQDPDNESPDPDGFITTIFHDAVDEDIKIKNKDLIFAFSKAKSMLMA